MGLAAAQELLAALSPELCVKQGGVAVGGVELEAGAELFCEKKQGFYITGSLRRCFDPPDRWEHLKQLISTFFQEHHGAIQLTFRSPRPAGELLACRPPAKGELLGPAPALAPAEEGLEVLPVLDSPQRQQDPADGVVYTWKELQKHYSAVLPEDEIAHYWRYICRAPPGGSSSSRPASNEDDAPAIDNGHAQPRRRGCGRGRGRGRSCVGPASFASAQTQPANEMESSITPAAPVMSPLSAAAQTQPVNEMGSTETPAVVQMQPVNEMGSAETPAGPAMRSFSAAVQMQSAKQTGSTETPAVPAMSPLFAVAQTQPVKEMGSRTALPARDVSVSEAPAQTASLPNACASSGRSRGRGRARAGRAAVAATPEGDFEALLPAPPPLPPAPLPESESCTPIAEVASSRARARGRGRLSAGEPLDTLLAGTPSEHSAPSNTPAPAASSRGRGQRGRGRGRSAAVVETAPAERYAFDALAWLNSIEASGVLAVYASAVSANFASLEELRQAYEAKGSPEFYKVIGVTKLGHKRLLNKAIPMANESMMPS